LHWHLNPVSFTTISFWDYSSGGGVTQVMPDSRNS